MGQFNLRNSRPDAQRVVADAKTRADGVEKRKRKRGANGRWFVKTYAGLSVSGVYYAIQQMGGHPMPHPSREHTWTPIGGEYGFSFQEEALDFFREFILAPADLKFDGEGLDLP